jgi:hypothetical protein
MITGPLLWSRLIAVLEDWRRRPANCDALLDSLRISPGDLLAAIASLIALWLDLRDTIDSGSSKGGGGPSESRPRGPSGEPCMEEVLVGSWAVSGDVIGDACSELEVTEEALIADAGMDDGVEDMDGRKPVCT